VIPALRNPSNRKVNSACTTPLPDRHTSHYCNLIPRFPSHIATDLLTSPPLIYSLIPVRHSILSILHLTLARSFSLHRVTCHVACSGLFLTSFPPLVAADHTRDRATRYYVQYSIPLCDSHLPFCMHSFTFHSSARGPDAEPSHTNGTAKPSHRDMPCHLVSVLLTALYSECAILALRLSTKIDAHLRRIL
jgi:hypothetical protein